MNFNFINYTTFVYRANVHIHTIFKYYFIKKHKHIHLYFRIQDLELAVDRMKQTKEHVTKKLKEESERKVKLEVMLI